jgi:hypothetical protein
MMATTTLASSRRRSIPLSVVLIVVLPALAVGVVAVILAAEAIGVHPWATPRPVTISEAAVLGAAYQAVHLIRQGQDPNAVAHVRAGLVDGDAYNVTPIDAAILGRRTEMITLLRANGARVTNAARSVCLANAVGMPDAVALLVDGGSVGIERADSSTSRVEALHLCESRE